MKKYLALFLAFAMIFTIIGCTVDESTPEAAPAATSAAEPAATPESAPASDAPAAKDDDTLIIGFSQCVMNHPFRIAMVETFKTATAVRPYVIPIVVEGDGDVQTEITNIESLIQQGADAIIVSSLAGASIYPAYRLVYEAGIPLIIAASGNAQPDEDAYNWYQTFVAFDEIEMGMAAADYADMFLNGEGNIVMIRGVVESTNSANRYVGWNKQIVNYPGLNVIVEQAANWLRYDAIQVMTNILQANPNIDLVYAENDEMALGALQAIRDAGREDEIVIISMDGQQDAVEEILTGGAFKLTITANPDTTTAVDAAVTLARGGTVERRIIVPYEIVTPENAQEFYDRNFR